MVGASHFLDEQPGFCFFLDGWHGQSSCSTLTCLTPLLHVSPLVFSELRHSNALKLVEALSQLKRQFQSDRDQRLESTVEALAQVATVPKQRNQRLVKVTGRYSKIHEGIALAAAEAATAATPLSTTAIASSVNGNATTSAAAASVSAVDSRAQKLGLSGQHVFTPSSFRSWRMPLQ